MVFMGWCEWDGWGVRGVFQWHAWKACNQGSMETQLTRLGSSDADILEKVKFRGCGAQTDGRPT